MKISRHLIALAVALFACFLFACPAFCAPPDPAKATGIAMQGYAADATPPSSFVKDVRMAFVYDPVTKTRTAVLGLKTATYRDFMPQLLGKGFDVDTLALTDLSFRKLGYAGVHTWTFRPHLQGYNPVIDIGAGPWLMLDTSASMTDKGLPLKVGAYVSVGVRF